MIYNKSLIDMENTSNNRSKKEKGSLANPFVKIIEDKKRIVEAIRKGEDMSKLKDIKFAFPI